MSSPRIEVDITEQCVRFYDGEGVWFAPCSTSANGTGFQEGSNKTPTGHFHVSEKIGQQAEWGTIFKSRVPTGSLWKDTDPPCQDDLILTRILRLDGDDPENANTRDRYIYFHGTNHEDQIGTPSGHGCIRMRNDDIIELFDMVEVGTPIQIF